MKENDIKNFLNTMVDSIDKDNIDLYEKILNSSNIKDFNNPEEFYFSILYPWDKFIRGFLKTKFGDSDVEFIYKNHKIIDRHFKNLFSEHEGSACSADKSRNIVNRLVDYYLTGNEIEFDYEAKYTYHLPNRIFNNHQDIIDLYQGIKNFMYGNPTLYNETLERVLG